MVQSPSWEANWLAASQEIPRISQNPKVQYHTHKRPPPVPILGQPNPVPIYPHPTSWRSIRILSTHLRLGLPVVSFPPVSPPRPCTPPLSSPIHATCPAHLILLDFITRIISSRFYHPHNIGWGDDASNYWKETYWSTSPSVAAPPHKLLTMMTLRDEPKRGWASRARNPKKLHVFVNWRPESVHWT